LPTVAILDRLNALDDAPWADLNGRPLDNRRLSKMLGEYVSADGDPIASRNIRTSGGILKGFFAKNSPTRGPATARSHVRTSATPLHPSSEPLTL